MSTLDAHVRVRVFGENQGTAGIFLLTANGLQYTDAIFAGFAMTSLTNAWYISGQAGQIRPEEVILIGVVLLQILVLRYLQILPISINDLIATGLPPVGKKRRRRRRIADSTFAPNETSDLFRTQCDSLFMILRKLDRQDCLLSSLCILESLRTRTRTRTGAGDDGGDDGGDGHRFHNTTSRNNNNNNDNDNGRVNSTASKYVYANQSNAEWMWMDETANFETLLPKQIKWTLTSLRKSGRERRHVEAAIDANPEAKTIPDRPIIAVFEEAVEYGAQSAHAGVDCDLDMDMDMDMDKGGDYSNTIHNDKDYDDMTPGHKSSTSNSTSSSNVPASICERRYSLCPLSSKEILSYIHSILIVLKNL